MVETSVDPRLLPKKVNFLYLIKLYEYAKFTHHGKKNLGHIIFKLFYFVKERTCNNMIRLFTDSKLY